jgi:hypothetical protein
MLMCGTERQPGSIVGEPRLGAPRDRPLRRATQVGVSKVDSRARAQLSRCESGSTPSAGSRRMPDAKFAAVEGQE